MTLKDIFDLVTNTLFVVGIIYITYYKHTEAKSNTKNKLLSDMEKVATSYVHSIAQTDFSGRQKMKAVIDAVESYFISKGHAITPEEHALLEGMAQKAYDKMKLDNKVCEASDKKISYSNNNLVPTPETVSHETADSTLTPTGTFEGMSPADEQVPVLPKPNGENGADAQNLANNSNQVEREG
ncbi:MAG: hypothetical protein [Bacteriophage sp.]|nr:MAG: hypothetical protein [Bacteriophage sp.]